MAIMKKPLGLTFILILLFTSCHGKSKSDTSVSGDYTAIENVLNERNQALSRGDIKLYDRIISPEYYSGGTTKGDVLKKVSGIFKNTKSRRIEIEDRAIYIKGNRAEAVQKIKIILTLEDGRQKIVEGTERIILTKKGNQWKITGGL